MTRRLFIASHAEDGGIYDYELNDRGALREKAFYPLDRPAYLAIDNDRLYAVLREPVRSQSGVVSFRIGEGGSLSEPSEIVLTHGAVAPHLCIHQGAIYCPNYLSGTSIRLPDRMIVHTGHGSDPVRQETSHPHQALPTPDGKYIVINDLGTDTVGLYDLAFTHLCASAHTPAGSGARHGVFSADGRLYYCVGEMGSNVSVFTYANGSLTYRRTYSTLPEGYTGSSTASAIRLHGPYLYVSNRGHDSIAVFRCHDDYLSPVGFIPAEGASPREFHIVGDFLVVGNENTDTVTTHRLHSDGLATFTGTSIPVKKPWGILPFDCN